MLKTLITKLAKTLFRPRLNPGYQTRVYPKLGEMAVIHDTLDFGPIATASELQQIKDIWISNELPDIGALSGSWFDEAIAFDAFPTINPGSGLPMTDGILDVAGNVYGMSDCGTDFHSDMI